MLNLKHMKLGTKDGEHEWYIKSLSWGRRKLEILIILNISKMKIEDLHVSAIWENQTEVKVFWEVAKWKSYMEHSFRRKW